MKIFSIFLVLFMVIGAFAQENIKYTNNMTYVLGDVKQAFIQNKISNKTQVDNLIKGFINLKVNGIRIPVFAKGLEPNKAMLDYFYQQAKANGFKIFANPALHAGGRRIANGVLLDEDAGGTVKNDTSKTQLLINRIKAFAQEYPCDWICPFNEDSKPDGAWSVAQFNTIFQQLQGQLNGAELIGACQWGIDAGIETFEQTKIDKYIRVATTHNLGFNHNLWKSFISLSKAKGLQVWDSEVNHNKAYEDKATRLEAALANTVDGLVLYNSWEGISLSDGSLSNKGRLLEQQALFLNNQTSTTKGLNIDHPVVYPNPASDYINVFGVEHIAKLTLINLQGVSVLSENNTSILNTSGIPKKIYLLKIESNDSFIEYERVSIK